MSSQTLFTVDTRKSLGALSMELPWKIEGTFVKGRLDYVTGPFNVAH